MIGDVAICLPAEIVYGVPTALVTAIGVLHLRLNRIVDAEIERLQRADDEARARVLEEARSVRRPR